MNLEFIERPIHCPPSQSQPGPTRLPKVLPGSYGKGANKPGEANLQDELSANLLLLITPIVGNSQPLKSRI